MAGTSSMTAVQAPFEFHGGIAIDMPRRTRGTPLLPTDLPPMLRLPLVHRSMLLRPVVGVGESVHKGQIVACGSVDLHAPTSGVIVSIAPGPATHPSAPPVMMLALAPDGRDAWDPRIRPFRHAPHDLAELIERIRHAGIVGLGGGGFPTPDKLARLAAADGASTLIVNAVESEPEMTSDEALLQWHAGDVLSGTEVVRRALGIARCIIALDPANEPARIALMRALSARPHGSSGVELALVPPRYPAGSERQLLRALTGVQLRTGQRPSDLGYLIQNPATLHALYRAAMLGQPLIERIVTVTGPAVPAPAHGWVHIGHPVVAVAERHLQDAPSRLAAGQLEIRHGGPVTGWRLTAGAAVTKQTFGIYLQAPAASESRPCINCSRCAEACPELLVPQLLLRLVQQERTATAADQGLDQCIECGACDLVCPSRLPLLAHFRHGRSALAVARAAGQRAERAKERHRRHLERQHAVEAAEQARREARLQRLGGSRWLPQP
jgi:Na+-translocating ferredoxin:NAD+ oxidoreductase subunit C